MEEARDALGSRLKGCGIVWSAALSAVLVSDCMASAAPAPGVVASTVEAAAGVAAGKTVAMAASVKVAALTEGVLKTMFLTKLKMVTAALFCIGLVTAGVGGFSYTTLTTAQAENRREAQPNKKKTPPEDVQDARLLVEKARVLSDAKALVREKEAILKEAQVILSEAQQRYEEAQDRYEAAKAKEQAKEGTTVTGTLVNVAAAENSVRVEYWTEVKLDGRSFTRAGVLLSAINGMTYENFPVAKDATILQDNIKTKLADLKNGSHIALKLDGKNVMRITADGGMVGGPIRYVSANEARNTITVIAGRKDERRVYHLVKETEVVSADGKTARVKDLREGTMLLLTRSVEDANTVIRIEIMPPDKEKED